MSNCVDPDEAVSSGSTLVAKAYCYRLVAVKELRQINFQKRGKTILTMLPVLILDNKR